MTDETHVQIYRSRPRAEASLHVLADAFSALAELRMMGHKSSELSSIEPLQMARTWLVKFGYAVA